MNATPRERSRKSYLKNRAKVLARSRDNYLKNKETRIKQIAAWRAANPQKVKEILRNHRLRNSAKCRAACRASYARCKTPAKMEAKKQWAAAYRASKASDPEYQRRHKEYLRQYLRDHPEQFRAASQRRRALKKAASVNLKGIKTFFALVRSSPSVCCYYCGNKMSGKLVHFDHIVPLARGGLHAVENLCVSCPSCNLSKQDRTPQAWIKCGQQLLAL